MSTPVKPYTIQPPFNGSLAEEIDFNFDTIYASVKALYSTAYQTGVNVVTLADGGTGAALMGVPGGIVWTPSTSAFSVSAAGVQNSLLYSNVTGAPTWTTCTFPSETILYQILYSSATNVIDGIPTVASAVLTTTVAGAPEWVTVLPSALLPTNVLTE